MWVNRELHGTWLFNSYRAVEVQGQSAVLHWTNPDFLRPMLDPSVGLLWTAPLAVLALAGILRAVLSGWRGAGAVLGWCEHRSPPTPAAIALGALVMYYVVACVWWTFTGFGHRYLSSCTMAYILGLSVVLSWATKRPWRAVVTGTLIAACVGYELGLLIAVDRGMIVNRTAAPLYAWFFGA